MHADMNFNGTQLDWTGQGMFKATSGIAPDSRPGGDPTDYRNAAYQSIVDHGPIPEGWYSFPLMFAKDATMTGAGALDTREGIERLPGSWTFHGTQYDNFAWGPDRVRLTILKIDNPKTADAPAFYLHRLDEGLFTRLHRGAADVFRSVARVYETATRQARRQDPTHASGEVPLVQREHVWRDEGSLNGRPPRHSQ